MKRVLIAFGVVFIIALGFFREFIFTRINEYLFSLWYNEPSMALQELPWLAYFDYYTLYYGKWGLTLLFALSFYTLSCLILKWIFHDGHWKTVGMIYTILIALGGLAIVIGWLFNNLHTTYILARFVLGIAQSPLILMIMIPGVWLRQRQGS